MQNNLPISTSAIAHAESLLPYEVLCSQDPGTLRAFSCVSLPEAIVAHPETHFISPTALSVSLLGY